MIKYLDVVIMLVITSYITILNIKHESKNYIYKNR